MAKARRVTCRSGIGEQTGLRIRQIPHINYNKIFNMVTKITVKKLHIKFLQIPLSRVRHFSRLTLLFCGK